MIYSSDYSIFDADSIVSSFTALDTQFNVVQGRINSVISKTGIDEMADGDKSIVKQMSALNQTVDGFETVVYDIREEYDAKLDQYYTKSETSSAIEQKAGEIRLGVTETLKDYSTTSQTQSMIEQKAGEINLSVQNTLTEYSTSEEMNETIKASQTTVSLAQGHLFLGMKKYDKTTGKWIPDPGLGNVDITESIRIWARGPIVWDASNSRMTEAGFLTCTGGKIAGWDITERCIQGETNGKYTFLRKPTLYTNSYALVIGSSTPCHEQEGAGTDAPFRVRADGIMYAKSANIIDGVINMKSTYSGFYMTLTDGALYAGKDSTERGQIDASASVYDNNARVTRYGITSKSGCVQFQTDLISATPNKNTSSGYTGASGWLNVITEIKDLGNGRLSWTTKPIYFQHGLMCTDIE